MAELPPYPGTPRWVKVFGTIVIVVLVLFLALLVTRGPHGGHGPGLHATPGDPPASGVTPPKQRP